MNTIANRLVYLMELHDMKQTELAEKIGISKQSLYKYLHCGCEPKAEIIARMARVLNTSADYLVGLTNDFVPVIRNKETEEKVKRSAILISKFNRLSNEDKIRIEERINMMLEE